MSSNSLQIAESAPTAPAARAPKTPRNSSRIPKLMSVLNSKAIIALITSITSIAVTLVGTVAGLHSGNSSTSPDKKLTISGTIKSSDGKQTLEGLEVFFLPEGNSLLTTTTVDGGEFHKELPLGKYSIVVRESINGMSSKVLLSEDKTKAELKKLEGAIVNYSIDRQ
ncbi:MAG: hypothetical protein JOZ02_08015 [Acidobacteria bacterium]|nr:hypothetical protein [Acidobacteriota bacterium]